jgi:DNA-binding MarR family transcriptional regulator
VLEAVPLVHWFIRQQMRGHRGCMSLPQFRSLVRVDRTPWASLSLVAQQLGASLPTTSRIVGGLVDKGLLARGGNRTDRRRISLVITPRGRAVLAAARRGAQKKMEAELFPLNHRQRAAISAAMEILANLFGPLGRDDTMNGHKLVRRAPAANGRRGRNLPGNQLHG